MKRKREGGWEKEEVKKGRRAVKGEKEGEVLGHERSEWGEGRGRVRSIG